MDDDEQLRFRNGELTAEVRMLNEKLTVANNAITYLLNRVSVRDNEQNAKDIARLEQQHNQIIRKNRQLKTRLDNLQQKSGFSSITDDPFTEGDDDDDLPFALCGAKRQTQKKPTSIVDSSDESLIDFSEHSVLVPEPAPKTPERPQQIGTGPMRTPPPVWEQKQHPKKAKNRDIGPVHVPMPKYVAGDQDKSSPKQSEVSPAEHKQLAGEACYIEEKDGRESMQFWQDYAMCHSARHARGWRQYYEEEIRPSYLESEIEKARWREALAVESSTDHSQKISTQASSEASMQQQIPTKSVELPAVAGAEEKIATEGPAPSVESDDHQVVASVSTPSSTLSIDHQGSAQPTIAETHELAGDSIHKPTQPSQASTANKEPLMLEPLRGLPEPPAQTRSRLQTTFHQVVGGTHASQLGSKKGSLRSRFMDNSIIPTVNSSASATTEDTRPPFEPHHVYGGRPPRQANSKQASLLGEHAPSCPKLTYPNSVGDLFAKPASFQEDPSAFRSVVMGIPQGVNLRDALAPIRFPGMTLYSASYFETSKWNLLRMHPDNHIILIFLSGITAQEFLKHQLTNPTIHISPIGLPYHAYTYLIPTATRPIPPHIHSEILSRGLTRVLWILCLDGAGHPITPLDAEGAWRALVYHGFGPVRIPLHTYQDDEIEGGKIYLEFATMLEAKTAWNKMTRMRTYFSRTTTFGFAPDPCGRTFSEKKQAVREWIGDHKINEGFFANASRLIKDAQGLPVSQISTPMSSATSDKTVMPEEHSHYTTSKEQVTEVDVQTESAYSLDGEISPVQNTVSEDDHYSTWKEAHEVQVSMESAEAFYRGVPSTPENSEDSEGTVIITSDTASSVAVDQAVQSEEVEAAARELEG